MKQLIPGTLISALIWASLGAIVTLMLTDNGSNTCELTRTVNTCYNALNR